MFTGLLIGCGCAVVALALAWALNCLAGYQDRIDRERGL